MTDGVAKNPGSEDAHGDRSSVDSGLPVVRLIDVISLVSGFPALAGLTLTIEAGEIVLVQGPNGAGKSTLLRLLAGLGSLDGGSATVMGHDLSRPSERRSVRRQAGLLAHDTFLYDELTVEENVRFWARANRVAEPEVEPVLRRLGLAERLRTVPVSGLSAGQRRRTSLAAMVCRRPRLWLLDEPHAGLDRAGRDFIDELVGQAADAGATVVICSHDIERAAAVATRTFTIAGGTGVGERSDA